jgi:hypothetical protein
MLHDVMGFARETIPGVKTGEKPVSVVMTHDWGICIAFAWYICFYRGDERVYADEIGRSGQLDINILYTLIRSCTIHSSFQ